MSSITLNGKTYDLAHVTRVLESYASFRETFSRLAYEIDRARELQAQAEDSASRAITRVPSKSETWICEATRLLREAARELDRLGGAVTERRAIVEFLGDRA